MKGVAGHGAITASADKEGQAPVGSPGFSRDSALDCWSRGHQKDTVCPEQSKHTPWLSFIFTSYGVYLTFL